ncbi:PREDICTED: uncharacterized protein LOC109116533 [Tarenaya hassleriana]|uniref:uncharacterized protein LOC109116533 n=1 Tax=Tarenaya hassleriana TaxID=28532 RepID=UPI0008FD7E5C|nr:PREDICTED: uncharacterized protein LOC109116533 [Tarenaya hassleriana]
MATDTIQSEKPFGVSNIKSHVPITLNMEEFNYDVWLKKISDLLSNIEADVSDKALVMHLLNGLNEKFDNIVNVIKHKTPFPTFEDARSMLALEEQRLSKITRHQPSHADHSSAPNVLYTTIDSTPPTWSPNPRPPHHRDGRHGGRRGRNRGRRYYNNHHPRGQVWNNTNWPTFWPHPWSHSSYAPGILGPNPGQQPPVRASPPQWSPPSANTANIEPHATSLAHALNTMTLQNLADNAWYMDSGATAHLTNQPGNLRTVFNSSINPSVTVGDFSYHSSNRTYNPFFLLT